MKGTTRSAARCIAAAASLAAIVPAYAMIPVFDIPNFFVNAVNNKTLFAIHHQLKSQSKGTVVYNTVNIDKSTDISAKIDIRNIDIDAEFTWIINQGGGEIIPIPGPVRKGLDSILNWKAPAMFTAQFKAAADFEGLADVVHSKAAAIDGSRARKAANDTLITSLGSQQDALKKGDGGSGEDGRDDQEDGWTRHATSDRERHVCFADQPDHETSIDDGRIRGISRRGSAGIR